MFLAYANPDRGNGCEFNARDTNMLSDANSPRVSRQSSAAPHIFLNYTGHSGRTERTLERGSRSGNVLQRRFESWGESPEDFEKECLKYLEKKQGFGTPRASLVSKALRTTVEGTKKTTTNAKYAHFLSLALATSEDQNEFNDLELPDSPNIAVLQNQIQKQMEEIDFLRSAMRALIPLVSETPTLSEQQGPIASIVPLRQRKVTEDVPRSIHIHSLGPVVDDLTMSEYMPIEELVNVNRVENYPLFRNESLLVSSTALHDSPIKRSQDFGLLPNTSISVVQAMDLLNVEGTEVTQLKVSYTEMAKGAIHGGRARGMLCQVQFRNWGLILEGRYNGMIREGLPHGSGVIRFENRDCYVGQFSDGMLHGEGSLFLRRNKSLVVFRGLFWRSEFIGESHHRLLAADDAASAA